MNNRSMSETTVLEKVATARRTDSRARLLELLSDGRQWTITELSKATNLHPNTTREHLHLLIDQGAVLAEAEDRQVRGRPRVLYRAINRVPVEQRGQATKQLAALVSHLTQVGFSPTVRREPLRVELRGCPLRDMVAERGTVVCEVHLHLARRVLASVGGPLRAEAMRPLVEPRMCLLMLS